MRIGPRRYNSIKKFFIVLRFNLTKSDDLSWDWHWKNYDRGTFSGVIAIVGEFMSHRKFFPQFEYEEKLNANLQAVNRVLSHSKMNQNKKWGCARSSDDFRVVKLWTFAGYTTGIFL